MAVSHVVAVAILSILAHAWESDFEWVPAWNGGSDAGVLGGMETDDAVEPLDDIETLLIKDEVIEQGFVVPYTLHAWVVHGSVLNYRVLPPKAGCGKGLNTPKETAQATSGGCEVAINAGFFDPSPPINDSMPIHSCLGVAYGNGREIVRSTDARVVMMAVTQRTERGQRVDGGRSSKSLHPQMGIAVGFINRSTLDVMRPWNVISGQGWLVRHGASYVAEDLTKAKDGSIAGAGATVNGDGDAAGAPSGRDEWAEWSIQRSGTKGRFANLRAPRAAVGHDRWGRLILAVVDGEEARREGLTLFSFAAVLQKMGLVNVINLDGGGSVSGWMEDASSLSTIPSDRCPVAPPPVNATGGESLGAALGGLFAFRCPRKVSTVVCVGVNKATKDVIRRIAEQGADAQRDAFMRIVLGSNHSLWSNTRSRSMMRRPSSSESLTASLSASRSRRRKRKVKQHAVEMPPRFLILSPTTVTLLGGGGLLAAALAGCVITIISRRST